MPILELTDEEFGALSSWVEGYFNSDDNYSYTHQVEEHYDLLKRLGYSDEVLEEEWRVHPPGWEPAPPPPPTPRIVVRYDWADWPDNTESFSLYENALAAAIKSESKYLRGVNPERIYVRSITQGDKVLLTREKFEELLRQEMEA
jgi:hypothetical protein